MPTARGLDINHDPEPVRLFQSNFLEFFTHIHPAVIVAVWLPVVLVFLTLAISDVSGEKAASATIPLGFLLGLFLWTPTEYCLHRFIFHFRPQRPWQERVSFLFHGIHHYQPQVKTRLVMPPIVSIPLALIFFGLFWLVLDRFLGVGHWVAPTFAGFLAGYLVYDLMHYATHHIAMRRGVWKWLKRYHMSHHFKTPTMRFGVSSPLWDAVFATLPSE